MIAMIGGSGNIGLPTIRHLVKRGMPIRVLIPGSESPERLKSLGVTEVVIGDFRNDSDVKRLLEGCSSVFHVIPPLIEDEAEIGYKMIAAARTTGVEHIVYISVFHPQLRNLLHHARKLLVEEAVIESGLEFNIIQPAILMRNLMFVWQTIRTTGIYPVYSSPEKKFGLIDTEDLGEAIAKVLIDRSLRNATFELSSSPQLTYTEIAKIISEELGRPIQVKPLTVKEREEFARKFGWTEYAMQAFLKMCENYDEHGFPGGNALILKTILGRQPGSYRDFLKRVIAEDKTA